MQTEQNKLQQQIPFENPLQNKREKEELNSEKEIQKNTNQKKIDKSMISKTFSALSSSFNQSQSSRSSQSQDSNSSSEYEYKYKPSAKVKLLDSLAQVKESLKKPIAKQVIDAKVQYYISSNGTNSKKKRQLSVPSAESGAFKHLLEFIDNYRKNDETFQSKLIRKQSCYCSDCGGKTTKEKRVDMALPQFKPKQTVKKMHREHFKKVISNVNKINQFFKHKLQEHQITISKNKNERKSAAIHSSAFKKTSPRSPMKHKSFSRNPSIFSNSYPDNSNSPKISEKQYRMESKDQTPIQASRKDLAEQQKIQKNNITFQELSDLKMNGECNSIIPLRQKSNSSIQPTSTNSSIVLQSCFKYNQLKKNSDSFNLKQKIAQNMILNQIKQEASMDNINHEFLLSVGHRHNLQNSNNINNIDQNSSEISPLIDLNSPHKPATIMEDLEDLTPQIRSQSRNSNEDLNRSKQLSNYYLKNISKPKTKQFFPIFQEKKIEQQNDKSLFQLFNAAKSEILIEQDQKSQFYQINKNNSSNFTSQSLHSHQSIFQEQNLENKTNHFLDKQMKRCKVKNYLSKTLKQIASLIPIPLQYDPSATQTSSFGIPNTPSPLKKRKKVQRNFSSCQLITNQIENHSKSPSNKHHPKKKLRQPNLTSVDMLDTAYLRSPCKSTTVLNSKILNNRVPFDLTQKKEQFCSSLQLLKQKNVIPSSLLMISQQITPSQKKLQQIASLEYLTYSQLPKKLRRLSDKSSNKLQNHLISTKLKTDSLLCKDVNNSKSLLIPFGRTTPNLEKVLKK